MPGARFNRARSGPPRRYRWLWLLPFLVLGACGDVPRPAPDVEFVHLDGSRSTTATYRGQPLLVLFWATSCPTCLHEQAAYQALYQEWKPRGLALVAVAMPYDPPDRVLSRVRRQALDLPVALDVQGKVVDAFGDVPGTPTCYLVGPDGRVLRRWVGAMDFTALREVLARLLPSPSGNGS